MSREKQVAIAAKLYQSRQMLRKVYGSGYAAQVIEYMRIIDGVSAGAGGHLSAGLQVAQEMTKQGHDASVPWIFAATVELIEPDDKTPHCAVCGYPSMHTEKCDKCAGCLAK